RFNSVVLPAPFGPTMPSASPSSRWRLTSSIALTERNDFETPWSSTRAGKALLVRDRQELPRPLQPGHALAADDDELVLVLRALAPLRAREQRLRHVRHRALRLPAHPPDDGVQVGGLDRVHDRLLVVHVLRPREHVGGDLEERVREADRLRPLLVGRLL